MEIFKVGKTGTDIHMIDNGGNHFISKDGLNGTFRCVNPTKESGGDIGDTYVNITDRVCLKIKAIK